MDGAERTSQFRRLCAEKGLAVTHQRQIIYDALMHMSGHPSPEAVYEKVRRRIPSISLGTVYKNIKTFVEAGICSEVSLHHGSLRLETNMTPHHHLICRLCKTIVDLDEDYVAPVRIRGQLPEGFEVNRCTVEVVGICRDCTRARRIRRP